MNIDNIGLSPDTLEWYKKSDYADIKSAMEIGKKLVTSNNYQMDQNDHIAKLHEEIEALKNETQNLIGGHKEVLMKKDDTINQRIYESERKYKELENRQNSNNEVAIKVAVENKTAILTSVKTSLEDDKKRLQLQHDQKESELTKIQNELKQKVDEFNKLKTHLTGSKNKGEFTEKEIEEFIELEGYEVLKAGNKAGDRHVYYNDELICVLEIKNISEKNEQKLGPNGSEPKKMYRDIDEHIKKKKGTPDWRVPWLFISIGCKIPNIGDLKKKKNDHNGVMCDYLSLPTKEDIMFYINAFKSLNSANKCGTNIELKTIEVHDIINKVTENKPDFDSILKSVNTLESKITKEKKKYDKELDNALKRINDINNYSPDHLDELDLDCDINTIGISDLLEYSKKLQLKAKENQLRLSNK